MDQVAVASGDVDGARRPESEYTRDSRCWVSAGCGMWQPPRGCGQGSRWAGSPAAWATAWRRWCPPTSVRSTTTTWRRRSSSTLPCRRPASRSSRRFDVLPVLSPWAGQDPAEAGRSRQIAGEAVTRAYGQVTPQIQLRPRRDSNARTRLRRLMNRRELRPGQWGRARSLGGSPPTVPPKPVRPPSTRRWSIGTHVRESLGVAVGWFRRQLVRSGRRSVVTRR